MTFKARLLTLCALLQKKGHSEEAVAIERAAHYIPDDAAGVPSFWRRNYDYGEGFYYGDMSEKPPLKEWRKKHKEKGPNWPKKKKRQEAGKRGPKYETLKKNKKPLTEEERKQAMDAGCVWHHGPNGEETCAIWKAEVNGETWYVCNTHRAMQVKPTLPQAIKAFEFIKTTA